MIQLPTCMVREATRLYGETIEKVAISIPIDPAAIAGAVVGGYLGDRYQYKMQRKEEQKDKLRQQRVQTIENNYYAQIENLLAHLKIIFTPINVLYSVNNQVFEIIRVEEMNPVMKNAFLKKDHDFFRNLLVNKINMELQLAERVFTQRMLQMPGFAPGVMIPKQACVLDVHEVLRSFDEDLIEKVALDCEESFEQLASIHLPLTFDAIRPFERSEVLVDAEAIHKVAGFLTYFRRSPETNDASTERVASDVKVGFLPDRVVFVYQGQMIDQLPLFSMNEEGYHAFTRKDNDFFLRLFRRYLVQTHTNLTKEADEAEGDQEKTALEIPGAVTQEVLIDAVKDAIEDGEYHVPLRGTYELFLDADIHPLAYVHVFQTTYGNEWHESEIEALLRQIEEDFELENGISDVPLNKILALFSVMSSEHTVFDTAFSFEKWMRAINNKNVDVFSFEGNLTLDEFAFGFDMIRALLTSDQFWALPDPVADYVANALFTQDVRLITTDLYDETHDGERDFFESVNDLLKQRWLEADAFNAEPTERELISRLHEHIVQCVHLILRQFAEELDVNNWYQSLQLLIANKRMLELVPGRYREAVQQAVILNVAFHLEAAINLQTKRYELEDVLHALETEG